MLPLRVLAKHCCVSVGARDREFGAFADTCMPGMRTSQRLKWRVCWQVWARLRNQAGFVTSLVELDDMCNRLRDKSAMVLTVKHGTDDEAQEVAFYDRLLEASFLSVVSLLALFKKAPGVALILRDSGRTGEAAKQLNSRVRRKGILLPFTGDSTTHVTCLDQLYAQANEVQILIRKMARTWAYASRGMFPVSSGRKNTAEEPDAEGVGEWVMWSLVQSPPSLPDDPGVIFPLETR